MKIFLGNGPWSRPGFYGVRAGSRWPHFEEECSRYMPFPFYLGYATALLERDGYACCLIDGIAERILEDVFIKRAVDFGPDLVVLEVSTASLDVDLRQARAIKAGCPGCRIAFAGPHVEMHEPAFLEKCLDVDFVLQGEYDVTLLGLVRALDAGEDVSEMHGIGLRLPDGSGRINPRAESIKSLDELPWPARKHLPMHNYYDLPGGIPEPSLQMWASRGCPFRCNFCAWPQLMYGNNTYRTRDSIDIVDEIEYCVKEWGFRSFYFDDDTFNIGKKRILKICEELQRRNIHLPWAAMCRADTSDRETLMAMRDSGLIGIKYGVESASQELVDAADKGLDLSKVEATVAITRELGIRQHLTFSFGLPGETWKTVRQTIDFAKRLDPETVQFSIMTPYPGSRFYKQMVEAGHLLTDDYNQYDGSNTAVVCTEELSPEDLENALKMAYNEWDWHKLFRPFKSAHHFKRVLGRPRATWQTFKHIVRRQTRRLSEDHDSSTVAAS